MIAFTPAFRVTEIEETGDVTVHLEEGVTGYVLTHFDAEAFLGCDTPEGSYLLDRAFIDMRKSAQQVDFRAFDRRTVISVDEMNVLTITVLTWQRDRREAFLAEQAAEEADYPRALAAGELDQD